MDLVFNGYAFQHICNFLDPSDIINMCHVYPYQWGKLYHVFKNSVIRRLDDFVKDYFGCHYNEFRKEMIQNKAVISGSIILQMILNEKWIDSDIDIFVPVKGVTLEKIKHVNTPKTPLEDFFYFTTMHACGSFFNEYPGMPATEIQYVRDYVKMDDETIKQLENLDVTHDDYFIKRNIIDSTIHNPDNKIKFQIIHVDVYPTFDTMVNYIYDNFDLDICKNVFYYDSYGCHLTMLKSYQIIDRKTNFNFQPTALPMCRYKKYKDRGFNFFENKETIFNMMINKCLIYNNSYEKQPLKRYKVFEINITNIGKETRGGSDDGEPVFCSPYTFEIIKNVSNDTMPFHNCKKNLGTFSEESKITIYGNRGYMQCSSECPVKIFLGDQVKHAHFHILCWNCSLPDDWKTEYIFIRK
jgi:hypothetical protein